MSLSVRVAPAPLTFAGRRAEIGRDTWRTVAAVAVFTVALAALGQLAYALLPGTIGIDFVPLRAAAQALLADHSVYTDPTFVYPPPAAVPLLPLAAGSALRAYQVWVTVGVGALALAAAFVARVAPTAQRLTTGALLAAVLIGGSTATDSLWLGNMTPVLVPGAVYVLASFENNRWKRGCAVLAVSLLIKPLLLPLLLIPVVRRQWGALAVSLGPAAAALVAAWWLVPGARELSDVARYVLKGTNLHGTNVRNNLSLAGFGEYNRHPHLALLAAVVVGFIGVMALLEWTRLGRDGAGAARLGTALLLTVFLAGRISEVHFLLVVIATTTLSVALAPTRRAVLFALPGLAVLTLPHEVFGPMGRPGHALQALFVAAQLLLLIAALDRRPDRQWSA